MHTFPSSIKGDALGYRTLLISSHFLLESWAFLERNFKSCCWLCCVHAAKAGGLDSGKSLLYQNHSCRLLMLCQVKNYAVFRAVSYTTEDVGYSLYFYYSNPLCPVTWFLINKQWKISLPFSEDVQQVLWMLQLNCGNHGVLQLWNTAMFTHKIYSYNVTCTRDVRILTSGFSYSLTEHLTFKSAYPHFKKKCQRYLPSLPGRRKTVVNSDCTWLLLKLEST